MNHETIVAVYDTPQHAAAAVQDLLDAGVPASEIQQHRQDDAAAMAGQQAPHPRQGFWASLFGGEPDRHYDADVYDRSIAGGGAVVSVQAVGADIHRLTEVLERHHPVDIDDRGAGYATPAAGTGRSGAAVPNTATQTDQNVIPLSQEELAVSKRAINRGTTRVRRYVVETPVSEDVVLRDETVSVERRPASASAAVPEAAFTDKVIEMTETGEEAVVSKTARVTEEVVLRKDISERTETVRDTLRKEEVEVSGQPGHSATRGA